MQVALQHAHTGQSHHPSSDRINCGSMPLRAAHSVEPTHCLFWNLFFHFSPNHFRLSLTMGNWTLEGKAVEEVSTFSLSGFTSFMRMDGLHTECTSSSELNLMGQCPLLGDFSFLPGSVQSGNLSRMFVAPPHGICVLLHPGEGRHSHS